MEIENTSSQETLRQKTNHLFIVTPFSKYLAMTLFVIMPFIGGLIGYTLAPLKIIEIEKLVITAPHEIPTTTISTKSNDEPSQILSNYPREEFASEQMDDDILSELDDVTDVIHIGKLITQYTFSGTVRLDEHDCYLMDEDSICYRLIDETRGINENLLYRFWDTFEYSNCVLRKMFFSEKTNSMYFTAYKIGNGNVCQYVKFDGATLSFDTIDYGALAGSHALSPSHKLSAQITTETSIEIYDFELDSIVKTIRISQDESLYENMNGYDGPYGSLEWIDENTVRFGVYKPKSEDNQNENQLIEYRTISI